MKDLHYIHWGWKRYHCILEMFLAPNWSKSLDILKMWSESLKKNKKEKKEKSLLINLLFFFLIGNSEIFYSHLVNPIVAVNAQGEHTRSQTTMKQVPYVENQDPSSPYRIYPPHRLYLHEEIRVQEGYFSDVNLVWECTWGLQTLI